MLHNPMGMKKQLALVTKTTDTQEVTAQSKKLFKG
jgi:hypothetical protein